MFEIELGEGSASFQADKRWDGGRRGRGHTPDLEVDLPRGATVVIEAGSADIEADGLAGDQRYRTASGDMTLRAVSGRVAVDAVSGDVDISATGEAAMTIKTVSGDVELRAGTLTALDATTTSGDLRIAGRLDGPGPFAIVTVSGDTLLAPAGDVRIEMATLSGDIRSKVGGRTEGGRGRRSLSVGAGGPLVSFRSLSGDLLVVPPTPVALPAGRAARPRSRLVRSGGARPPPSRPSAPPNGAIAAAYDDARLRILRSLERGEIDVAEAGQRLEALDGIDPLDEPDRRPMRTHPRPRPPPGRRTTSTAPRPPGSTRTRRLMPDDALERVLRLVAEGRLTADEAGRSSMPSTIAPAPSAVAGGRRTRIRRSGRGHHRRQRPRSGQDAPGRGHRGGRAVINLRIPLSLGRAAINQVPGISDATSDRIREAIEAGHQGLDRRGRRRRRRGPDLARMTALDVVAAADRARRRGCRCWHRSPAATSGWSGSARASRCSATRSSSSPSRGSSSA